METRFIDRREAGRALGAALARYAGHPAAVVLGLPRGGMPVAFEVARTLGLPLDVFLVRKLGVPGQEELAMGAIASGGVRVINPTVVEALDLSQAVIDRAAAAELAELQRRERAYRGDRPPLALAGRIPILVDDGLATGSTMLAAVTAAQRLLPARVVVAVPVAPNEVCQRVAQRVDELVCLLRPEDFWAVGLWYENFAQTTDAQVRTLLEEAARGFAQQEARS